MAKYLNLDGLQTLWAKLKDTFALKKHSHTVEDIPVDDALSSTSENPVQNKVVNTALDTKRLISRAKLITTTANNVVGRYFPMATAHVSTTGNINIYGKFRLTVCTANNLIRVANVFINARFRSSVGISAVIEDASGLATADVNNYFVLSWDSSTGDVTLYANRFAGGSSSISWTTWEVQQDESVYGDYGNSTNNCNRWTMTPATYVRDTTKEGDTPCVQSVSGTIVKFTQPTKYHVHNDYVPFQKTSIYGCRVKRAKTGGNWFDNNGFQIVESYASSFRTHWVTFRWASAAQMNGTANLGCRRFLFGYEETGRFLRCFVSEDDTYWYVWLLFMTAKTEGTPGGNASSVMQMQSVPNGLEVLTTAPDMTNLTEIPWAADERYAPKSHNHDDRYYTETEINSKNWLGAVLIKAENDLNSLTHSSTVAGIYLYKYNAGSKPLNIPTSVSGSGIIEHIIRLDGNTNNQCVQNLYTNDSSNFYYSRSSNGSSWTDWKKTYYEATSTYSSTGTQAVNGTAVASAISGKANAASVTGATKCKVTYNSQGVITAGADLAASDIPNLTASKITSGTFADERIASASKWNAKQDDISDMIPTAASASNPLCDKAYADAIGERLEARYIGCNANGDPFATHAALTSATKFYYQGAETTPDTNDITTVVADEDHKNTSNVAGTTRYRYGGVDASGEPVWAFEYVINNTGLSQAQLLAVNSGITATKVGNYDSHLSDTTKHITAAERTAWNGKQNALTQGTNITISGNTISATDTTYSEPTDTVLQDIVDALT